MNQNLPRANQLVHLLFIKRNGPRRGENAKSWRDRGTTQVSQTGIYGRVLSAEATGSLQRDQITGGQYFK